MQNPYGSSPIIGIYQGLTVEDALTPYTSYGCTVARVVTSAPTTVYVLTLNASPPASPPAIPATGPGITESTVQVKVQQFSTVLKTFITYGPTPGSSTLPALGTNQIAVVFDTATEGADPFGLFNFLVLGNYDQVNKSDINV